MANYYSKPAVHSFEIISNEVTDDLAGGAVVRSHTTAGTVDTYQALVATTASDMVTVFLAMVADTETALDAAGYLPDY